jgi:hypothetical protein
MQTPEDRYRQDTNYRHLVSSLEALIARVKFTPSEVREAAMLACVHHEMRQMNSGDHAEIPEEVNQAMERVRRWREECK